MTDPINRGRPWTPEEDACLKKFRDDKMPLTVIAEKLGRSVQSIAAKLNKRNERRIHSAGRLSADVRVPDNALDERDRRMALEPRDTTAAFCGDPLPGYSALEKKR